MRNFAFHPMRSVDETIETLDRLGEEAFVMAGGQTLLNQMKFRVVNPKSLVWISPVADLRHCGYDDGGVLRLGAATTYESVQNMSDLRGPHQLIAEVTNNIADQSVRNMGTVGGAVCTADPHQDYPTLCMVMDARMEVRSTQGLRSVAAEDFFVDYYVTDVQPGELLTALVFMPLPERTGLSFQKFNLRPGDYARVIVASQLTLAADGTITDVRMVIGATQEKPVRATAAEKMLLGHKMTDELAAEVAALAAASVDPLDELFASPQYKKELVSTLAARSLMQASMRAEAVK